jgi:hypothetical protein
VHHLLFLPQCSWSHCPINSCHILLTYNSETRSVYMAFVQCSCFVGYSAPRPYLEIIMFHRGSVCLVQLDSHTDTVCDVIHGECTNCPDIQATQLWTSKCRYKPRHQNILCGQCNAITNDGGIFSLALPFIPYSPFMKKLAAIW